MFSREKKFERICNLTEGFKNYDCFYILDMTGLNVNDNVIFRRNCRNKNIVVKTAKNSLISKSLNEANISNDDKKKITEECLKEMSTILFVNELYSLPGKVVSTFKNKVFNNVKLKCACIAGEMFYGNEQLKFLSNIKTKKELISEIITSLKSGFNRVLGGITCSKSKIASIVEALKKVE